MTYILPRDPFVKPTIGYPINKQWESTPFSPLTNPYIFPQVIQSGPVDTMTTQPIIEAQRPNLDAAFKPKRAARNTNLSHVIFVLDESGSMSLCKEATISGYNEYLLTQKEDAKKTGIKTLVSLYKFNGYGVTCSIDSKDIEEVQPLNNDTYRPSGGTNLYDAIGGVMMAVNSALSAKKKKDRESIIITVLTDGEENMSRTFSLSNIKPMIEIAESKNWGFMFLGANIDAFATGVSLGFKNENTLQFLTTNSAETIRSASDMTSRMKTAYAAGLNTSSVYGATAFNDEERNKAVYTNGK
jgi:hypothetical protein